jgi:hypothetical protein
MVGNPSVVKKNLTVRTATNSDLKPMSTQGGGIIFEGQVISPTIMIIMPIPTMTTTFMERLPNESKSLSRFYGFDESTAHSGCFGRRNTLRTAIPNSECSQRYKRLDVFTGKGFAMKIAN